MSLEILLVNHEFTITGASLMLFDLAGHLRAEGHRVSIFASVVTEGAMKERYLAAGFPVLDEVDFTAYELVLCNTVYNAERVIQAAPHSRTLWWLHETEAGLTYLLEHIDLLRAFDAAAAIVFQTAFQRDTVYRSFTYNLPPRRLVVIPNGLTVEGVLEAAGRVPPRRRPLRVIAVGSVDPRKRQEDLVLAVHHLARAGAADIECVICGKFFEMPEAVMGLMTAAPERFTLLPELPRAECLAWIAASDIFCLPSLSESQPLTVLEAALLGRPLLLTDLPPYRGLFSHGRNCLLYPTGDVIMLAHWLAVLAADAALRDRLGAAAEETARWFSPAAFHAGFDTLLHHLEG